MATLATWLLLSNAIIGAVAAEAVDADIVLSGGTVHVGDGEPGRVGDVAVKGDRIVAVGDFATGDIGQIIDCRGLIVAPGFIDLHNHSDGEIEVEAAEDSEPTETTKSTPRILAEETGRSVCYLTQGCTTLVTGNCGGGALDVAEYYAQLDETPAGVNVAHLIPQGAVREAVVGTARRSASEDELQAMEELVERGMRAGAWGMTTGLQYVPSAYADTEEIARLARVVGEHGGLYASHIRDEGDDLEASIHEAITIGRLAALPVHVSHFKASKRRNWGKVRSAAALIEEARQEGLRVTADQYPYAASSTSVAAMLLPDSEREGTRQDLADRLGDPKELKRLRPIVAERLEARGEILLAECPKHPDWVGKRIREIAHLESRDPVEVAIDVIRSQDEAAVSFSMDEHDVRWVMALPWVATASDGSVKTPDGTKPHPRSYGTFARRVGRYSIQEEVVPLAQAIRSASGLPADILGMRSRGYLREGLLADIVVFDPATFRDVATFESPHQQSTGVRWLLVNGELAIADGEVRATDLGRALRMPIEDQDARADAPWRSTSLASATAPRR